MLPEQVRALSPALSRALEVLASMSPADLQARPGRALAEGLGVDPGLASRYLSRLVDLGVVSRVGSRGITVRQITDPRACDLRSVTSMLTSGRAASAMSTFRGTPENDSTVMSTLTGDGSNDLDPSSRTPSKVDIVRKVRAAVGDPKRTTSRPGSAQVRTRTPDGPLDLFLVDAYVNRRRRIDPSYDPPPAHVAILRRARVEFQRRGLPVDRWAAYLDDLFERFPRVTGGECHVPPARVVAADGFLDRFLASLPPRRLDVNRALRMLRTAGFDDLGDHLITAITIAREARAEGNRAPDDEGIPPRMREAIAWILSHFDEIGTVETEE